MTKASKDTTQDLKTQFNPCIAAVEHLLHVAGVYATGMPRGEIDCAPGADFKPVATLFKLTASMQRARADAIEQLHKAANIIEKAGHDSRELHQFIANLERFGDGRAAENSWPSIKAMLRTNAPVAVGKGREEPKPRHRKRTNDPIRDDKIKADWEKAKKGDDPPDKYRFEDEHVPRLEHGELTRVLDRCRSRCKPA